ncbi:MAG: neutral zinc metallopeptidase [Gammaproteobacteria bacterium]|jgi:predicted metalloprotease|nr:neutral zinc metallopeptidase [Gammaproteobacteria bacterium]
MRWRTGRRSDNVEDERGSGGRMPVRLGGAGGGGIGILILLVAAAYFGIDPSVLIQGMGPVLTEPQSQTQRPPAGAGEDELKDFVSVVLADTEDTWNALFREGGRDYEEPKLVLFSGAVNSACGFAQAAMGPFYCPPDQKVYIDLSFYDEMRRRFGAPGDFAQAYVIAHEIGHHVQNLLGISDKVQAARRKVSEAEGNALSVKLELQADCLAGLWAHHADKTRQILESGDVEEALNAAAAIGDDRLQKQSRGYVAPDSFTHGSSAQRVRWFKQGLQSGQLSSCDTFNAKSL